MRYEARVVSISWIPSEAIQAMAVRMPFEMGITHYDPPPPDHIDDVQSLIDDDAVRFANELTAWIEVEDGRIVDHGQSGRGYINTTTARVGSRAVTFRPTPLPTLTPAPRVDEVSVTFTQTAGGNSGIPAPRRVRRPPYVQLSAPLAWTTLTLTLGADGSAEPGMPGASRFPRHWVYGPDGNLVAKSGLIEFQDWYREAFGKHSPWGDEDSPALVTEIETALERELSVTIMRGGAKPELRRLRQGDHLTRQGEPGNELYLLLDGVLAVDVDGRKLAELGPGAIIGERAILEGGTRTATLTAASDCRVAVAHADAIDKHRLQELSQGHRREEDPA